MTQGAFPPALSRPLEAVLAERGALPVEEALPILRQLLVQVRALHASGRTHRAIGLQTVHLDPAGGATLTAPEPVRELDGLEADGESCPPELHGAGTVRLPAEIEAARRELERAGVALDPRRIDVYQLGALLCRLLTGQAVSAYLRSPKVLALAPAALQPVVTRAIGYSAAERFADCDAFAAALEVPAADDPTLALALPDLGSDPTLLPDTTPKGEDSVLPAFSGQAGKAAGSKDGLPFERLGHYRILRRIGRGGMGDVYLGFEDDLKRQVAIKVLPAELMRGEDFVRRFRAEATAVARLTHPNIVPIYFVGQDAGCHFFAMQYVEGESLDHLLARRGRLGVDETLAILEQCLAGLGAAHRAGLVHRDVKPGNVLLEAESGRALVADFGLVKGTSALSGATASGVIMGTVDYIAPEQARGQEVDGRSDLYSVGVMAYRMLSGRLPFEAKTPTAMLFQHAYETPKPLGEAAPDVPEALAALVGRLMAKDPAARYRRCEEAAADVRRLRVGSQAVVLTPRPSQIIAAPDLGRPPELAAGLERLAPGNWWWRVRDRAADLFQAHAPEFVKELQSTTQQVDGALAEYQRRRDRLANLVGEARQVIEELAVQAKSHREAAVAAARRADSASGDETAHQATKEKEDCERSAAELERQVAEQRGQLEQMRSNLVKTDATLGRLRSQRDLLKARLRVAEARLNFEGGRRLPRRRWLAPAAVLFGLAAVGGVLWLVLTHSQPAGKGPAALTPPTADLFVVLGGEGQTERAFATLKDAVDKAQSGDTIEIRGDGPFETIPLALDKALTVRAGNGHRPVLVHNTDGCLFKTTAPLVLEGLELRSFGNKSKDSNELALIKADGSTLRIAHCRIMVSGFLDAISTRGPLTEVRDSELNIAQWSAISEAFTDRSRLVVKNRLVIKNCLLIGMTSVHLQQFGPPSPDAEAELTGNTFLADWAVCFDDFVRDPADSDTKEFCTMHIKAAGNVFQSAQSFEVVQFGDALGLHQPDALTDWHRDHVVWEPRDNLFAVDGGFLVFKQFVDLKENKYLCKTLKDWQTFRKSETAFGVEGSPRFAGGNLLERNGNDMANLAPADFQLEKGSPGQGAGPGGKDLGADVDCVGPGPAYERWKASPEYQDWVKPLPSP